MTIPSRWLGGARCQLEESPHRYTWPLGLARDAKRRVQRLRAVRRSLAGGHPSRFVTGQRVRIKTPEEIRAILDEHDALRGTPFMPAQWSYRGTYEVERPVRRFLEPDGRIYRMSRAVVLRDVTCDGADGTPGCGRSCALFYRDEWLEPSDNPPVVAPSGPVATVKSEAEIRTTLDRHGRLDGMSFRPEMSRFAGRSLPVLRRLEYDGGRLPWWKHALGEWYALSGARCGGEPFAADGGCDRSCALAWHRAWLTFDDEAPAPQPTGDSTVVRDRWRRAVLAPPAEHARPGDRAVSSGSRRCGST